MRSAVIRLHDCILPAVHMMVKRLLGITISRQTSQAFISSLGLSPSEFQTPPTELIEICQHWLVKRSVSCDMEELVEALVTTKGLGKYTSHLSPAQREYAIHLHLSVCWTWVLNHVSGYLQHVYAMIICIQRTPAIIVVVVHEISLHHYENIFEFQPGFEPGLLITSLMLL